MPRRIRVTGEPIKVDDRLAGLGEVFARHAGVVAAYLYGSYGTADQTPLSDVDLAIVYRPDREPTRDEERQLVEDILDALGEDDVSVTNLNAADVMFQFNVVEGGRLLYCRDPVALADFHERVFKLHGDFIIDYQEFVREYDRTLVEAYPDD